MSMTANEKQTMKELSDKIGQQLPTDDTGMFELLSAIIVAENVELIMLKNDPAVRREVYDVKRKKMIETKEGFIRHICDVKGFDTWFCYERYLKWYDSMMKKYREDSEQATERVRCLSEKIL